MKTIGMLGGMSWESTVPYYRIINEHIRSRLGGLHSARILMHSVDFHEFESLMRAGNWSEIGRMLAQAAATLETAGAECLILCTNTMHKVAPAIEAALTIPFIHIADAAAAEIARRGIVTVGLLGTRFTMEQDFYVQRLHERHGLEVLVPEPSEREEVHRVIFEELVLGRIIDASRASYHRVIDGLITKGAQGIILGCTEIGMLIMPAHVSVPTFDTTIIHATAAASYALSGVTAS